jgi:hypothetical protein
VKSRSLLGGLKIKSKNSNIYMAEVTLHGFKFSHPDDDHMGLKSLHRMDQKEVHQLFEVAREHGQAEFQSRTGQNYSVTHDRGKGTYSVIKK